jgi:hypothetical protein
MHLNPIQPSLLAWIQSLFGAEVVVVLVLGEHVSASVGSTTD